MVKSSQLSSVFHRSLGDDSPSSYYHLDMTKDANLAATLWKEAVCNRFRLAQEATGLRKGEFAARLGLSPSQLTNIYRYRNPPPPQVIARAVHEFGFTTDWFYTGTRAGMRDPELSEKLRRAAEKLDLTKVLGIS